jgi:hypothetical protein
MAKSKVLAKKDNQPDKRENLPTKPRRKRDRSKVTLGNLENFQQEKYCENVAAMVSVVYPQLIKKMEEGNMKAIEMGLQVLNILKPQNGISVVTQIYNRNQVSSNSQPEGPVGVGVRSMESILRRLEATEAASAQIIDTIAS